MLSASLTFEMSDPLFFTAWPDFMNFLRFWKALFSGEKVWHFQILDLFSLSLVQSEWNMVSMMITVVYSVGFEGDWSLFCFLHQ